ncbi:MAG: DUF1016 N-terminal domain-containing protein [Microcoleus sp. CAN_BIN18]|nr:DUF1016 N-terminal domain-containing protein [Microcoleus sp. CAN_BIN18]
MLAQIPWGHNLRILDAVKYPVDREWYIRYTIEQGWSRNLLVHQIGGIRGKPAGLQLFVR